MKERPILYSTPMAQAKRDGTKTQTRRTSKLDVINQNPDDWTIGYYGHYYTDGHGKTENCDWVLFRSISNPEKSVIIRCPYGFSGDEVNPEIPSDVLWGRETWHWDGETKWSDACPIGMWWYKSNAPEDYSPRWKPSIHMPKIAAQLWDRIVSIRVERLQDISEQDAITEGIIKEPFANLNWAAQYRNYLDPDCICAPIASYRSLWESINGPGSWYLSPWVWVITTEILSTTGRPENL